MPWSAGSASASIPLVSPVPRATLPARATVAVSPHLPINPDPPTPRRSIVARDKTTPSARGNSPAYSPVLAKATSPPHASPLAQPDPRWTLLSLQPPPETPARPRAETRDGSHLLRGCARFRITNAEASAV